jgi:hypothetical protein
LICRLLLASCLRTRLICLTGVTEVIVQVCKLIA